MKHFFSTIAAPLRGYARCAALLLGLGGLAPAAWGQSFGPVSRYSMGTSTILYGVSLGDINGDGYLDIVSASVGNNTAGVLTGMVGGGFAPAVAYSTGTGSTPFGVELGDVNGDGRLDIVTPNIGNGRIAVLLGQSNGGFAGASSYTTGNPSTPSSVALGDINGDGRLDIVADNGGNAAVLLGQASGFAAASTYPISSSGGSASIALGDLNADGRLDVVTTNFNTNAVGVLFGLTSGGFATASAYALGAGSTPASVAIGDVNGDGRRDIVTANQGNNTVGVLLSQASGGFATVTTYPTGAGSSPYGVALGDVNGDGRLDLVTANYNTNGVGVLLGQAVGFAPAISYSTGTGSNPRAVALGDVNGDGRLDIITTNSGQSEMGVLLNTGTFLSTALSRLAADLALYPNPARDGFTVRLPGATPTRAELLNALGQVVRRPAVGAAAGAGFAVETRGLPAGVYTLRLWAGGAVRARRVVVE